MSDGKKVKRWKVVDADKIKITENVLVPSEMGNEQTIAELRAEVEALKQHKAKYEADCKRIEYFDELHEKLATQARVIEIAKRVLHNAGLRPPDGGTPTVETICEDLNDAIKEIAAIEKEGEKDE